MGQLPLRRVFRLAGLGAAVAGALSAANASAADTTQPGNRSSEPATVAELVVTAQKRAEPIFRVPIAVTALAGSELTDRNIQTLYDINGPAANVTVALLMGSAQVTIRGVFETAGLPGSDPTVSNYVNGFYLTQSDELGAAYYDVARLEILKGPQGTLWGKNSTGGAINVITNLPTDKFEASEEVTVGNYNAISTRSVISGPLSHQLFVRLAVATDNHSGYSLNLFNNKAYDNQNAQSARLTAVLEPTSNLTFTTYLDYHREDDGNYATHLGGIVNLAFPLQGVLSGGTSIPLNANGLAINPRYLDDYTIPVNQRTAWGIAEEIDWRLNDEIALKSLTSYRHSKLFYESDFYGTTWPFQSDCKGADFCVFDRSYQVSEELQLIGTLPRINWIIGLYYLDDVVENGGNSFGLSPDPNPFPVTVQGSLIRPAYAAFGQATYHVTDRLDVTAGLRYSWESAAINTVLTTMGTVISGFCPELNTPGDVCHQVASTSSSAITPRFEAHYQWTDQLMTYASVSKGFKSGGFGIVALADPFLPSTVWTYEVGAKALSSDGRWSLTAAAFYSDYKNMQVVETINGVTSTINAAASAIKGVELEGVAKLVRGLTVKDSFGYLDARYTNFIEATNPNFPFLGPNGPLDITGHQLQYNSKFSNNLRVSYQLPLDTYDVRLSGEWNWRTKEYFSEFNDVFEEQPAFSLFNASLRYTDSRDIWFVEIFVKNITNALIISQQNIGGCGCINSQYDPPRTYGVTLSRMF